MLGNRIEIIMDEPARRRLRSTGMLLVMIGLVGILLPQIISITLSILAGLLLIAAGILIAYTTWYGYGESRLAWLRPAAVGLLGLLIILFPSAGAAAIGLILTVFFLLEGISGISLAIMFRPLPGWIWVLISGIVSLGLGIVFIAGWPFNATWLVGLLIGISLLFEGISLLVLANGTPS